ncbi:hypothetical protein L1987_78080 [Smallanthus sonchifolius]|uniref:Uncharacterized protein n=1 Tax=Smallanthus sonchifolius TaxID=185202 RepID=A0ACB8ZAS9_9ASTR|nr:hypothetical protein L1987_78080 [Smallanthus sonchifolius]
MLLILLLPPILHHDSPLSIPSTRPHSMPISTESYRTPFRLSGPVGFNQAKTIINNPSSAFFPLSPLLFFFQALIIYHNLPNFIHCLPDPPLLPSDSSEYGCLLLFCVDFRSLHLQSVATFVLLNSPGQCFIVQLV